jgi:hypothetical protein
MAIRVDTPDHAEVAKRFAKKNLVNLKQFRHNRIEHFRLIIEQFAHGLIGQLIRNLILCIDLFHLLLSPHNPIG